MRHFIVLITLLAAPVAAQSDWPGFRGPHGNNTSPEVGLLKTWPASGPPIRWTVDLGPGYGGAAVHGGEVFVFDRVDREADVLRVFDLETGEERWTWTSAAEGRLPYPGSRQVPAVTDAHVYVAGGFGHVHCIDRKTHRPVWRVHLVDDFKGVMPGFGYVQSPILHGDLVFVTPQADDAGVVALNRFTGKEVWRSEGLGTSHTTPTLMTLGGVPQLVFLSAKGVPLGGRSMRRPGEPAKRTDRTVRRAKRGRWPDGVGSVASFDPRTGTKLWATDLYFCWQPVCAPIKVDETHVFMTGGYRSGSLLIEVKRDAKGSFRVREVCRNARGSHIHQPIRHGDHLYLLVNENFNTRGPKSHREGGLMCMDLAGNEVWRTGAKPFFGRGHALKADGVLYIQDGNNGMLRVVDPTPTGYEQLAEANVFRSRVLRLDRKMWAPMALSRGRLLMRSQAKMLCIDLRARQLSR